MELNCDLSTEDNLEDNTWDKFWAVMQYATSKLLPLIHENLEPRIDFDFYLNKYKCCLYSFVCKFEQ